uniref:BAP29/BAP31 transmembrane domain-containing protein n=1 Tax=Phytophthora infestans TaxID=4787 RepID=Q8H6Z8_PHYIN|nr:unknown [Phytophthora infestans]
MASMWSSFTYVLLPPAVVLLLLMTIPFPGLMLNRGIVKFGDVVFNIRIGTLSVFSVITFVSFVVLVAQTYDLQKRYSLPSDPHIEAHYSADLQKKATRWRSERNWWIRHSPSQSTGCCYVSTP